MELGEHTAERLLLEISSVIDYDINIMNKSGAIIASTDPSRKGEFHSGASEIIHKDLDELKIYDEHQYQGCRRGINLPIKISSEIIGVIGITGEIEEVTKYGKLIRKITEILTKDLEIFKNISSKEKSTIRFTNNWLNGIIEKPTSMYKSIKSYGLDPDGPFGVVIIKGPGKPKDIKPLINSMHRNYKILTYHNNNFYIVIGNFNDSKKLEKFFVEQMKNMPEIEKFLIAIGSMHNRYSNVPESYKNALSVYQLNETQNTGIISYRDSLIELSLHSVSTDYKKKTINRLAESIKSNEISDVVDFIDTYVKCNGSSKLIAEELFIHKNTVQYKIKKIKEKTGLDLRIKKDMIKLYIISLWYKDISKGTID